MVKTPQRKTSRKGPPATPKAVANVGKPESPRLASINFKVPEEFRREFKTYAVQHGKTMLDLLQAGFELVKEQHE